MTPALLAGQVRVTRPTDRLDDVVAFYRDALGLPELTRFTDHAGYTGVILGMPGPDRQLEFTTHRDGSPSPAPSRDNLLVLSLDDATEIAQVAARLAEHGHRPVVAENPYWTQQDALTFTDPDLWHVVLAPRPALDTDTGPSAGPEITLNWHSGDRQALRPLFELAEDSPTELAAYLDTGRVLVARAGGELVGHLQLTDTGDPRTVEIMNMAVREDLQGRGIGRRLVETALDTLVADGVTTVLVATAAADVGNLRFYQRLGFRLASVERDAFTPATGYTPGLRIDGIPLLDRVRLDLHLSPPGPPGP